MSMNEKIDLRVIVAFILILIVCSVVSFFIGRANNRIDGGTGSQLRNAAAISREIADEQHRTVELNQRAIVTVERIRSFTQETDRSLTELGQLNRRSSDISTQIREEAKLLEDYFRGVSNIISNESNNMGSE